MRFRPKRPSPAMVIALIALLVALTGTSSAAISGIGQLTNKITSAQIKDGSIKSADIGKSQVKAEDISPGSVKASDLGKDQVTNDKLADKSVQGNNIAPDTITGANVVESTLQQVASALAADRAQTAGQADSATQADNARRADRADVATNADAVGGLAIKTFFYRGNSATGQKTILNNFGGLTLTGGCGGNDLDFAAFNSSGEAAEYSYSKAPAAAGSLYDFGALTTSGVSVGVDPDNTNGILTVKTASDHVVTVTFSLKENAGEPRCTIAGTAVGG
jgi:hypothetical protein